MSQVQRPNIDASRAAAARGTAQIFALALALAGNAGVAAADACRDGAARMARVELLFGATRPHGELIDGHEWQDFLASDVTPRFPAGLTVFSGDGQWRRADGAIERSPSRLLLIWYAPDAASEAAIEAIRARFRQRFAQESVLRVDGTDCVSF